MKKAFLVASLLFVSAGAFRSSAQVYSVNAVGYVNTTVTPGFNLVVNPLNAGNNSISNLFQNMTPKVPAGSRIYFYNEASGTFETASYLPLKNACLPESVAAKEIRPGKGVLLFLGGQESVTLTLVGEVLQGVLRNDLPPGYSIIGNQVPRPAVPPGTPGDRIYKLNKTTGRYDMFTCANPGATWRPFPPIIGVGEAVFYFRAGDTAGSWDQTFSVAEPSSVTFLF